MSGKVVKAFYHLFFEPNIFFSIPKSAHWIQQLPPKIIHFSIVIFISTNTFIEMNRGNEKWHRVPRVPFSVYIGSRWIYVYSHGWGIPF